MGKPAFWQVFSLVKQGQVCYNTVYDMINEE